MTVVPAALLRPELCRLPILIGVTGHRDLSDWGREAVATMVRTVLQAIKEDFGTGAPIAVVTSLAKGADQLVAEIALEMDLDVHAILPFAPERIEMSDPAAHAVLLRILENPRTQTTNLSTFPALEEELHRAVGGNTQRLDELHFEQAGLVVARHCHILLALVHPDYVKALSPLETFRPDPNAPIGGSRRVLEFWATGRLDAGIIGVSSLAPAGSLLRPVLTGPLIHIATPRDSKGETAGTVSFMPGALTAVLPARRLGNNLPRFLEAHLGRGSATLRLLTAQGQAPQRRHRIQASLHWLRSVALHFQRRRSVLPRVVAFNRRVAEAVKQAVQPTDPPIPIARSLDDLVKQELLDQLSAQSHSRDSLIARQRHLFAAADGLANADHKSLKTADLLILAAVPLSVLSFEIFVEVSHQFWILAIYVGLFAAAVAVFFLIRLRDIQNWYQDCRLVGEAARVQFFWSLAGLPHSVADEHQANELGDESWLYAAIKAVALEGLALAQRCDERNFVMLNWLGSRPDPPSYSYSKWYAEEAMRYREAHLWRGRWQWILFSVGYLFAIGVIVLLYGLEYGRFEHSPWLDWFEKFLTVLIPTAPAIGAVLVLWRERRAYEVHAHEYHRMEQLVHEAIALVKIRYSSPAGQARVLYEIGREALHEGARWLLAHRSQPVHPVPSG